MSLAARKYKTHIPVHRTFPNMVQPLDFHTFFAVLCLSGRCSSFEACCFCLFMMHPALVLSDSDVDPIEDELPICIGPSESGIDDAGDAAKPTLTYSEMCAAEVEQYREELRSASGASSFACRLCPCRFFDRCDGLRDHFKYHKHPGGDGHAQAPSHASSCGTR